jgi:hypothetical protein
MKKIHPESLLQFPLVRDALLDRNFKFQPRAIDTNWYYGKVIPISVAGFNPLLSTYFYPQNSMIAEWFKKPEASARLLNESDILVKEVFFMAHDYLHAWAYRCIHALLPKLNLGVAPVTKKNFEDYVFVHLLTEAVATLGVDYWFLSTIHLNDLCSLGSNFRTLTVSYHEDFKNECRRFNPTFDAQTTGFFEQLCYFYCDGVFSGFSVDDTKQSPMLLKWLQEELTYGQLQREYARAWFSFLCKDGPVLTKSELRANVDYSTPWRKRLIRDVGQLLWDKIKNGKDETFPRFDSSEIWARAEHKDPDFRFLNLNCQKQTGLFEKVCEGLEPERNFKHLFYQFISQYDYRSFDSALLKRLPRLFEERDFKLIRHLFRHQNRINKLPGEPKGLFILN